MAIRLPPYRALPCRPMGQSVGMRDWPSAWVDLAYGGFGERDCDRAIGFRPEWPRNAQRSSLASASSMPLPCTLPSLSLAHAHRSGPLHQSVADRSRETFFGFRQIFACHTRSNCLSSGCWLSAPSGAGRCGGRAFPLSHDPTGGQMPLRMGA